VEDDYDLRPIRPNGLEVRRRRHERKWSLRELVGAIEAASLRSSGIRESLTPNLISCIEEQNETIPYKTLYLLAGGLDCDPVDLLLSED
jgi:transcriptional regulator with XRE-family HTH domain